MNEKELEEKLKKGGSTFWCCYCGDKVEFEKMFIASNETIIIYRCPRCKTIHREILKRGEKPPDISEWFA